MHNEFYAWLRRMGHGAYTVKFTMDVRNASMPALHDDINRDYPLYRFMIRRRDVGAVYITASCACVYLVERDEDYVYHVCDAHLMLSMLEEARFDTSLQEHYDKSND